MSAAPPRCGADNGNGQAHKPRWRRAPETSERRTSEGDGQTIPPPDGWTAKAIEVWDKMPAHHRVLFHSDLWKSRPPSESVLDLVRFMRPKLPLDDLLSMATWTDGFGMADYRAFHLTCAREQWEVLDEKAQAEAQAKRQSGRLRILSIDELLALPPRDYLVKGWISPNETSLLVGAKNARKTFSALHVGYGIALGRKTIFGRRVHQAPVLYLIAEGERGIGKRVTALVKRYGRCVDFHVIAQQIDLLRSTAAEGDLHDIIELAKANGVRLIIVDTISRALAGGDENGPTDMGILSVNLNELRQKTGAHVMGIHHGTQEQGTKSRGHSTLPGGVDAIAQLEWNANEGIGRLALGFARDDVNGVLGAFRTEPVTLGVDADDDPITTLQVTECEPDEVPAAVTPKGRRKTDLSDTLTKFLATAHNVIAGAGEMVVPAPMMAKVRAVPRAIIRSEWIAAGCFPETDVESSDPDRKANNEWRLTRHGYSAENNALRGLERRGVLMFNQHWAWLP